MERLSSAGYRADIDGMRALAVLSIVLFHIEESLLPGGFVGVDIFFVISGYLITSIIGREMAENRFSFSNFYRRRILRIAPAYFAATLATLAAGCALMQPSDLASLARSALWSAFSLPNVYFWRFLDTSYFAPASDQVPLLHLWSLGVEEQFYLLWPITLLLLCATIKKRPALLVTIAALAAASFALGQATATEHASFAYYMLPARAGELLIGALLAIWFREGGHAAAAPRRMLAEGAALLGFALTGFALFALDGESTFPGLNALYPCLGTALLIAAGRSEPIAMAVLRWRPVVWIGLISYSMYLWHWPILAFVRYFVVEISPLVGAVCVVAILAVSALSYRFIEVPFRNMRHATGLPLPSAPVAYLGSVAMLALGAWGLIATNGLEAAYARMNPSYADAQTSLVRRTLAALDYDYNCQRGSLDVALIVDPRCVVGAAQAKHGKVPALLVGDSNAAHYVGVLGAIAEDKGFAFRNFTLSACPPLFGAKGKYGSEKNREDCTRYRNFIRAEAKQYDYVFLGGQWSVYARKSGFKGDLTRTIRDLRKHDVTVIVLAQVPRFPSYNQNCEMRRLRLPIVDCKIQSARHGAVDKKVNKVLMDVARANAGVHFFEITPLLCPRGECSPYLNGLPVYYNQGHLSMVGSWEVGRQLIEDGIPLRAEFDRLAAATGPQAAADAP